jgi:23S rRNA (guanosine2251-2'-O)-methyltransferase
MITEFFIFECTNPDCKLRFPSISGEKMPNWCPRCKSQIQNVASYLEHPFFPPDQISKKREFSLNLLLDNIRSAYNVGSILRSADGFNIDHIYLCGLTATPDNPKVGKTSLGAEKLNRWDYSANCLSTANSLKSKGNFLFGLELCEGSRPIFEIENDYMDKPIVLILGNELAGIDPDVRKICDELINIPMMGNKNSFNVTIAFGIAAFYLNYLHQSNHDRR